MIVLRNAMHKEFNVEEKEPILVPQELRRFCRRNGAETIFDNFLEAISDKRHSEKRREFNENRVVEMIHTNCAMQKAKNAIFFRKPMDSF